MLTTVAEIRKLLREADEEEFAALERSLVADTRKGVRDALETARRRLESERAEADRLAGLYEYERKLAGGNPAAVIVGLDEVGRGPLAGPLAVGAVVLPQAPIIKGLNDSKQVKPELREKIAARIEEIALAHTVQYVSPADIDKDGMTASLKRAFRSAIEQIESMGIRPDVVLIDGNPLNIDEREINVVKGDTKCASIAAASILAKVKRDALMCSLAETYPEYGFEENKGYGSPHHMKAIETYGLTNIHRKSFCRSFLQESLF